MCIEANFKRPTKTSQAITAYKVVTRGCGGMFSSMYSPSNRSQQAGFKTPGKHRQYVIGKQYQSTMRSTPGFYCYRRFVDATEHADAGQSILRVKIPANTKIVHGKSKFRSREIACCERLVVEEHLRRY